MHNAAMPAPPTNDEPTSAEQYVDAKRFARLAGVSDHTVRNWLKYGRIVGATLTVFNKRRWCIPVEANRELIERQKLRPSSRRRRRRD